MCLTLLLCSVKFQFQPSSDARPPVAGIAIERAPLLPAKIYTRADGLVSTRISRVMSDTRGFLWFGCEDGLARFDGSTFTNYTKAQGLPSNWIDDVLETRQGVYWVATGRGLCRFKPRFISQSAGQAVTQEALFTVYRPNEEPRSAQIKTIYEDRAGNLWCGTLQGLFRVEERDGGVSFHFVDLGIRPERQQIKGLLEDARGVLWIATEEGLFRRLTDGRIEHLTNRHGLPNGSVTKPVIDQEGKLWVGTRLNGGRLYRLRPEPDERGSLVELTLSLTGSLPCGDLTTLFVSRDGRLWLGLDCGLYEFSPAEQKFKKSLDERTLSDARIWSLTEDRQGHLWVGTAAGAVHLVRGSFVTFTEAGGLGPLDVYAIAEAEMGEILVSSFSHKPKPHFFFNRLANPLVGGRFAATPSNLSQTALGYLVSNLPLRDSAGEWWWPTPRGLARFGKLKQLEDLVRVRPKVIYTTQDGLPSYEIGGIYEDRQRDIWLLLLAFDQPKVVRWERATDKFHLYAEADGLPPSTNLPSALGEDATGKLWIGFNNGGLARHQEGRFRFFTKSDGVPDNGVRRIYPDRRGRLWVATDGGGLLRIDDPTAERLQPTAYTINEGLASNTVLAIAQAQAESFYVGTNYGLNQLDLTTKRVKRFTTADGLANDQISAILRDQQGAFWFGTPTGLSYLAPDTTPLEAPPATFIERVRIAGKEEYVAELGETQVRGLEIAPGRNNLQIDFFAIAFAAGELRKYQYRLEGADAEWSSPTVQRTVHYASLAPGAYRFLVRAVSAQGAPSEQPAGFAFTILPPLWQRWWFLLLLTLAGGAMIYGAHRYRLNYLLAVERMRTRLATDLHDEIGSSLSQISILSEVVHQQVGSADARVNRPLSVIAATSRELVDAMADIVWATNPQRDHLHDLVQHMREFASDTLTAREIEFDFRAPVSERDPKLDSDVRREVFLIFKESVTNLSRHSQCTAAEIEFCVNDGWIELLVSDNGRGFDLSQESDGHGLMSISRRAKSVGGKLEIASRPGQGTTIKLRVPLHRRRRFWQKLPPE